MYIRESWSLRFSTGVVQASLLLTNFADKRWQAMFRVLNDLVQKLDYFKSNFVYASSNNTSGSVTQTQCLVALLSICFLLIPIRYLFYLNTNKMTLGLSSFPGSVNGDILEAMPTDDAGRRSLLDEVKRRGRLTVQASNFKEAEALYGKGIEVSKSLSQDNDEIKTERAVLFSNRSLARYQMGNSGGSTSDARAAAECDPTYVKAFWRLGQACFAQQQYAEALQAYETAQKLDENNKAVAKELQKTRKKIEEESKLLEEACNMSLEDSAGDEKKSDDSTGEKQPSLPRPKKAKSTTKKTKTTSKIDNNNESDEDVQFSKSEAVRGYKIVAGKKTSYFHNELSDEAKKLIGDIAPKKLNPESNFNPVSESVTEGASAWNKAGTWEEKDVTQWATNTLMETLTSTTFTIPDLHTGSVGADGKQIKVTKVPTCEGHASVAVVRGKRRYIYEFSIVLDWSVTLDCGECSGSITFPDVDGTCDGVYDTSNYKVKSGTPSEARPLLDMFVKNGGLRDAITKSLNDWVVLFQSTY